MKRPFNWALPTLFAAFGAVAPVGLSGGSDIVNATEAVCLDCQKNPDYTCGTPPLDREGYCTAGAEWCKEQEE